MHVFVIYFKSYDLSLKCSIHGWTCDDFTLQRIDDQMLHGEQINPTRSRYRIFWCIFYFVTYSLKSFNWDIHVIFLVFHICRMMRTWERLPAKWTGERSSFTPNLYDFFIFLRAEFSYRFHQVFDQLRRKELQTLGNRLKCTVFKY